MWGNTKQETLFFSSTPFRLCNHSKCWNKDDTIYLFYQKKNPVFELYINRILQDFQKLPQVGMKYLGTNPTQKLSSKAYYIILITSKSGQSQYVQLNQRKYFVVVVEGRLFVTDQSHTSGEVNFTLGIEKWLASSLSLLIAGCLLTLRNTIFFPLVLCIYCDFHSKLSYVNIKQGWGRREQQQKHLNCYFHEILLLEVIFL